MNVLFIHEVDLLDKVVFEIHNLAEILSRNHNVFAIDYEEILLFFMGWIYEFSGMKEVAESISTTDNEKIKLMIER